MCPGHVLHHLADDGGGGVAPAAEVETEAPVRRHEGVSCRPALQVSRDWGRGARGRGLRSVGRGQAYPQHPGIVAQRSWALGLGTHKHPGFRLLSSRLGLGSAAGPHLEGGVRTQKQVPHRRGNSAHSCSVALPIGIKGMPAGWVWGSCSEPHLARPEVEQESLENHPGPP